MLHCAKNSLTNPYTPHNEALVFQIIAKDAVHHLAIALEIDPKYRKLVNSETDFDSIRNTKEFQAALSIYV